MFSRAGLSQRNDSFSIDGLRIFLPAYDFDLLIQELVEVLNDLRVLYEICDNG